MGSVLRRTVLSGLRLSELRLSELRLSELRLSELRLSELRVLEVRRLVLRFEGPRVDSSLIADTPSTSASGQQLCQPLVTVETLGPPSSASQDWRVGHPHVEHGDATGVDLGQHGL